MMSSDKIASVQEPVVSLDLDISQGQDKKIHSLELSKDELAKLISSLEGTNKVLYFASYYSPDTAISGVDYRFVLRPPFQIIPGHISYTIIPCNAKPDIMYGGLSCT